MIKSVKCPLFKRVYLVYKKEITRTKKSYWFCLKFFVEFGFRENTYVYLEELSNSLFEKFRWNTIVHGCLAEGNNKGESNGVSVYCVNIERANHFTYLNLLAVGDTV